MTETTEKISTEDKILLAERVMGWPPEDYCCTQGADRLWRLKTTFQEPLPPGEIEANRRVWAPEEDTAKGLWQAKQLLKALKAEGWSSVWFSEARGEVIRLYRDDSTHEHEVFAPTLSLAITRAVLAAARDQENRAVKGAANAKP